VALRGYLLGRAGVPHRAVITALGGRDTPDLAAFSAALAELPDGARVPLRYFELDAPATSATAVLQVDRRWYPMRRCRLDEASGRWPCTELPAPPPGDPPPVRETRFEKQANPVADALAASLVQVEFNVPFPLDGVHDVRFTGSGLVVDAERGFVVVDRETVPIALGDVDLTFAGSVRVAGELVYLHPEHDLAVVRYDPTRIGATPVRSAVLDPAPLAAGSDVWLVGLTGRSQLVSRRTSVSRVDSLELPLPSSPRFREMNLDAISLADAAPSIGGVIADERGRVRALWASVSRGSGDSLQSFMTGIPIARVAEIAEPLRGGKPMLWRSLGVEWTDISLAQARDRGLPEPIARELESATTGRRRVLAIARRRAGSPAAEQLRDGDLLAAIDGKPIADFAAAERAVQKPEVQMEVVRDGQLVELRVATEAMSGAGTERALIWAGALLQAPHPEVALQRGLSPSGVYVSYYFFGSPANRDNLGATRRIESVNGVATPDLDAFLRAVSGIDDRGAARLRTRTLDGKTEVITLRLDLEYWPTVELVRGPRGWERRIPAVQGDGAARRDGAAGPHGAESAGGALRPDDAARSGS
jgi:S1-C subfamily serine protease